MKPKSKSVAKKRPKRDLKTTTVSFRVTQKFRDQIVAATAASSFSSGEFLYAGMLSVVLDISAFEAGRIIGRKQGLDEIGGLVFRHAKEVNRYGQTLDDLFADTWAMNGTEKETT